MFSVVSVAYNLRQHRALAQLLLDAMVSAVAVGRGFNEKDYAHFHAVASLDKMLLGDKSL